MVALDDPGSQVRQPGVPAMNQAIVIALVAALGGFGAAWKIQNGNIASLEKAHVEQELADQRSASTAAIRRQEINIAAISAGVVREASLRRDVAGTRSALVGLSDASGEALRAASASKEACLERAATYDKVLRASAGRYVELAERADRHVNDIQTYSAACFE